LTLNYLFGDKMSPPIDDREAALKFDLLLAIGHASEFYSRLIL